MHKFKLCLLLTVCAIQSRGQQLAPHAKLNSPDPWFSTFSIIAYDPTTGELGVAVQSRAFGSGAAVPYAVAGVGAVATQASTDRFYGPQAISLLQQGVPPAEIVKRITDLDPARDGRQVAVIDFKGNSAAYTGTTTLTHHYAGSITGKSYSVQGNTLASEEVVKAMAAAYESAKGSMAERFMDVLDAGQSKGGDRRGMQSAGILIVKPLSPGSLSTTERIVDIRVDDSADPFKELRRILNVSLSRDHALLSAEWVKEGKLKEAIAEEEKASELNPKSEQYRYALAQEYAQAGEQIDAFLALRDAIKMQKNLKAQAAADPLFAKLKDTSEFKRLVDQTGTAQ
jgi:uncharacterized Ntn-hydrolase superfamily protein